MTQTASTPSRAELIGRLTRAVRRQVAWTVLHNQAIADRLGMGVTDLHCTNLLELEGPMTPGQLAELMGITTGAITGVLDRLERVGMVRREPDPADRRRVIVRLVPDGIERVAAQFAAIGEAVQEVYAGYDDANLMLLVDYSTRSAETTRRVTAELRGSGRDAIAAQDGELSAPLGDVTAGRLEVSANLSDFRIRSDRGILDLYRASFQRRAPRIRLRGGTVRMTFPGFLSGRVGHGEIVLNGCIPWEVELRGGAVSVDADLADVALSGLSLIGGVSRVEFRLPRPVGTVPLRIHGGASRVSFRRPTGVPFRVRVIGGASRLSVDGHQRGAIGGTAVLDSPGYEANVDRYELEVGGGSTRVTVDAY